MVLALPIPDPTLLPLSPPASVHSTGSHAAMPGAEHIHLEPTCIIPDWVPNGCEGPYPVRPPALPVPIVMFMGPLLCPDTVLGSYRHL